MFYTVTLCTMGESADVGTLSAVASGEPSAAELIDGKDRAMIALVSMPVIGCVAGLNLVPLFVAKRACLWLGQTQKLIFVQRTDPMTRNKRDLDALVE